VSYVSEVTNPDGKRTYYGSNQEPYTSTTTALSEFEDKTTLIAWKDRTGHELADEISNESAAQGTAAHKEVENFLLYGKVKDDNIFANVAIDAFYGHVNLDAVGVEMPLFYTGKQFKVAGRYDALVKLDSGRFKVKATGKPLDTQYVIADLKTKRSYEPKKKGDGFKLKQLPRIDKVDYLFKNAMQCSMYAAALTLQTDFTSIYGQGVTGAVLVYANEKNSRLMYLDRDNLNYYWAIFREFLRSHATDTPPKQTWAEYVAEANGRYVLTDGGGYYTNNLLKEIVLA
jgi:hypothetical protein